MTGARRNPVDKRRLRGSNRGLKKILVEGLADGGEEQRTWSDFSGAMVRHAVDDAMQSLPKQDHKVVKLAYFGGYSNREIAAVVGLTEGTVQRRLRRALAAISEYIQHGRRIGRRALYVLTLWLSGRWLGEAIHYTAPAAVVGAAAAVIIVAQPSSPAAAGGHNMRVAPRAPVTQTNVVPPVPSPTVPVLATPDAGAGPAGSVTLPPLPVPTPTIEVPKIKAPDVPPPPRIVARVKELL